MERDFTLQMLSTATERFKIPRYPSYLVEDPDDDERILNLINTILLFGTTSSSTTPAEWERRGEGVNP